MDHLKANDPIHMYVNMKNRCEFPGLNYTAEYRKTYKCLARLEVLPTRTKYSFLKVMCCDVELQLLLSLAHACVCLGAV